MSHDEETLDRLSDPAPPTAESADGPAEDPNLGRRVGPYRIERLIARGGMGAVYLATRQDDFEKRVALKLVHPKRQTVEVLRRFAAERQILARLEHPQIARILDGGTTDDALPFFVMEYVEGMPVDRYCDERGLALGERLRLFCQICAAVHFAHQNLVVHRDLKPQNILVTHDGVPKLLDFGIATILGPGAAQVAQGDQPMTPLYASPEQISGGTVTTASDIYSLGILLYQLVTGALPGRFPNLVPPSCAAQAAGTAAWRRLIGDLDAIVLKALRLDPAERYGSALQLAEDLRRHLDHRPVEAHAGSWLYRLRKLARRHTVGLAVALFVVVSAITSTFLWRQAVVQQGRAEVARQKAEGVAEFLEELFKSANPDAVQGETITLRQALDQGREKLAEELVDEPEMRAELLTTLGTVYNNLGLYSDAKALKEEALRTRRAVDPSDRWDLASDLNNLGRLHYDLGEYEQAEISFRQAREMWQRLGDTPHVTLATSNLAATLTQQGHYEQALELHSLALELHRRLAGPESDKVAASLYGMGALYRIRGELEQAEPLLRQALAIYSQNLGLEHTKVAAVESSLGQLLHSQGRLTEARKHLQRVLNLRRRLLGEEHSQVAGSERNLAALLLDQGETAAAGELLESALATLRNTTPVDPSAIAETEGVWGSYLAALGRFSEAEPYVLTSYETLRQVKGGQHAGARDAAGRVAELYEAWGRGDEAARFRAASSLREP